MRKLTQLEPHNQHPSRFYRRRQRQARPTIEASIAITTYRDSFGVGVTIYVDGARAAQDFRLLRPGEVSSPERAWLIGYALACEWVADHRPDARVIIVEPQERRRIAAA